MISHSFTHFLIQSEPFTRNSHGKCEFLTVLFVNEFCGKREPRLVFVEAILIVKKVFAEKLFFFFLEKNTTSDRRVPCLSILHKSLQCTLSFSLLWHSISSFTYSCVFLVRLLQETKRKSCSYFHENGNWSSEFNVWIVVKTTRQTTETVKEHIISCLDVTPADDLIAFNLYLWLWKRERDSLH